MVEGLFVVWRAFGALSRPIQPPVLRSFAFGQAWLFRVALASLSGSTVALQ